MKKNVLIMLTIGLFTSHFAIAQDDLYFNPATDEYFSDVEEDNYSDEDLALNDNYVDESFDDGDYYYDDDFYYTRRINRFNRPYGNSFGYFDPCYVNNFYYDPFYAPAAYVNIGSPFNPYFVPAYSAYPYFNPYINNPYFNPYNPYFNNPFTYGNPYYNPYYAYGNNNFYYNDYYNNNIPSGSYGPRGSIGGGTVDDMGNGRVREVKQGRNNGIETEGGGRTYDGSSNGNTDTDISVKPGRGSDDSGNSTVRPSRGNDSGSSTVRPSKPSRGNKPRNETYSPPPRVDNNDRGSYNPSPRSNNSGSSSTRGSSNSNRSSRSTRSPR